MQENFEFKTVDEVPEEQSSQKRDCPHCGEPISADSLFCLYCGQPVSLVPKSKWIVWVALFVSLAFILLVLMR